MTRPRTDTMVFRLAWSLALVWLVGAGAFSVYRYAAVRAEPMPVPDDVGSHCDGGVFARSLPGYVAPPERQVAACREEALIDAVARSNRFGLEAADRERAAAIGDGAALTLLPVAAMVLAAAFGGALAAAARRLVGGARRAARAYLSWLRGRPDTAPRDG